MSGMDWYERFCFTIGQFVLLIGVAVILAEVLTRLIYGHWAPLQ